MCGRSGNPGHIPDGDIWAESERFGSGAFHAFDMPQVWRVAGSTVHRRKILKIRFLPGENSLILLCFPSCPSSLGINVRSVHTAGNFWKYPFWKNLGVLVAPSKQYGKKLSGCVLPAWWRSVLVSLSYCFDGITKISSIV